MKKTKVFLCVFLFALVLSGETNAQSWLTNGLVAYYPLKGDTADASGNGKDGKLVGNDWQYVPDKFGQSKCLYLNQNTPFDTWQANGSYLSVPRTVDFNKDYTVSLWVNISSRITIGYPETIFSGGWDREHGNNLRLLVNWPQADGKDNLQFTGNQIIMDPVRDSWWHLLVVHSGNNGAMYKNGEQLTNGPMIEVINKSRIWFGTHMDGFSYPICGAFGDIRLYDRALSADEIRQLYRYESGVGDFEIKIQPLDQTVLPGRSATFLSGVASSVPYNVQWYFNDLAVSDIPWMVSGAQAETLKLEKVQLNQTGNYYLVAGNNMYSITSRVAHLEILSKPLITAQPNGSTNVVGGSVTLSIGAVGTQPVRYQWYHGWSAIRGATNSVLTLTNLRSADAGSYKVAVMNKEGSVKSARATLKVLAEQKVATQPIK